MRLEVITWADSARPTAGELKARLEADGFDAWSWSDGPGFDYKPHAHDHDESIWVVEGEITFRVGGRPYRLGVGDRLMLPAGTVHTAEAGKDGASYLIGERRA
jgi:quercetin dioxygenase-like cupin family protein